MLVEQNIGARVEHERHAFRVTRPNRRFDFSYSIREGAWRVIDVPTDNTDPNRAAYGLCRVAEPGFEVRRYRQVRRTHDLRGRVEHQREGDAFSVFVPVNGGNGMAGRRHRSGLRDTGDDRCTGRIPDIREDEDLLVVVQRTQELRAVTKRRDGCGVVHEVL